MAVQKIIKVTGSDNVIKEIIITKFDAITGLKLAGIVSKIFSGIVQDNEIKPSNIDVMLLVDIIPDLLANSKLTVGNDAIELTPDSIAQNFMGEYKALEEIANEVIEFNNFFDLLGLDNIPLLLKIMKLNYSVQVAYQTKVTAKESLAYYEEIKAKFQKVESEALTGSEVNLLQKTLDQEIL